MLAQITPVILTYNEERNLARTLAALCWAREIVIVDSCSDDGTAEIASRHANVRFIRRRFDTHAGQWNYAVRDTGVTTPWILALDADYVVTPELVEELRSLSPDEGVVGYSASFLYCVSGHPLRGSTYPPAVVLFRTGHGTYAQDGHTQRLRIEGRIGELRDPIRHDDRKTFARWLSSQLRYTELEARKLRSTRWRSLPLADKVRKSIMLAPALVFFYCLFVKGNVLDGLPGIRYACERAIAEALLSVRLLQKMLRID